MTENINMQEMLDQMRDDSVRWFGDGMQNNLTVMVLGLIGEAGEVADLLKKIQRGSKTLDEAKPLLAEELVDVFHYWLLLVGMLGINVNEVYAEKRAFNERRFGKE